MNPFKQTIAALLFGAAVSAAFAAESLFDFSVSDGGWKSTAKRDVVKRSAEYPAACPCRSASESSFFACSTASAWYSFALCSASSIC